MVGLDCLGGVGGGLRLNEENGVWGFWLVVCLRRVRQIDHEVN